MSSYPLTVPTKGYSRVAARLNNAGVAATRSPFTGARQVYKNQGVWWEFEITLPPLPEAAAGEWTAFISEMNGIQGTALLPVKRTFQGAASGTVSVDGAAQSGETLTVDGLTPGLANVFKAGDFISFKSDGTDAGTRLHQVIRDASADSSGQCTLTIRPELRESPNDDVEVEYTSPKCLVFMTDNAVGWEWDAARNYSISIPFAEEV